MEENFGTESNFNEASLKMMRIHNLQDTINKCWLDPTAHDPMTGKRNYEIIFSCNTQLLQETNPQMDDKEEEKIESLKFAIEQWMKQKPIFTATIKSKWSGAMQEGINDTNWSILKDFLYKYEKLIRKALNTHGLSVPIKGESGLF